MTDKELIARAYKNCHPEEPLEPTDPRWVDLDEKGVRGRDRTGRLLFNRIETAQIGEDFARILFSGFRGSGKSTALRGLVHTLQEKDFTPAYVDLEEFLNLQIPVAPYEVMLSIAGAIDQKISPSSDTGSSILDRIFATLQTEIEIREVGFSLPAGISLNAEIKKNLSFRQSLQRHIHEQQKQPMVIKKCREFIVEAVATYKKKFPTKHGLVIVLDNLEKLGDVGTPEARTSVINLFKLHADDLLLPCHTVYTIPPWLRFVETWRSIGSKLGEPITLPMVKVCEPENDRRENDSGINKMIEILAKRFDINAIFGEQSGEVLREVAVFSGGYVRDLLRLARAILTRINYNEDALPLSVEKTKDCLEIEIEALAQLYDTSLYQDDVEDLLTVEETHDVPPGRIDVDRPAGWFDNHFLLCYHNGHPWYDLHPLIKYKSQRFQRLKRLTQAAHESSEKE
ncbi:MAG: hypothetical protein P9L99_14240 [Candidatus Lernaella stagnicola]|nr:hypothetical protein [Candidatus Lernaella stagnicola]